jgi:hypothetical protein
VRVAEAAGGVREHAELHAALPHLDERLVARVDAEQRRLRVEALEVQADRDRLGEDRAVVELEDRHAAERVLGQIFG